MRTSHKVFMGDSCMSDADMAVVSTLYQKPIGVHEARTFYEIVCRDYGILAPSLKFTGTDYRMRRGTIQYHSNRVLIHKKGETVATVVHELAHCLSYRLDHVSGHGRNFAKYFHELLLAANGLLY